MRILLISDVHSNFIALESVLEDAPSADYIFFLGDAVDYGPQPVESVDWMHENVDVAVMGNHDNAVAFNTDCLCDDKIHPLSVYTRKNISLKLLTSDQIEFLKHLPPRVLRDIDGHKIYIVHGSPHDFLYGYIFPDFPEGELRELLLYEKGVFGNKKLIDADYVIVGHSHHQFSFSLGGRTVVNPGSVGQPRDGDWRASYAILDLDKNNAELRRIKYPVEKTIKLLESMNLEETYLNWLKEILLKGSI